MIYVFHKISKSNPNTNFLVFNHIPIQIPTYIRKNFVNSIAAQTRYERIRTDLCTVHPCEGSPMVEIDEENGVWEDDTETGDAEVEQQQVAGGPQGVEPVLNNGLAVKYIRKCSSKDFKILNSYEEGLQFSVDL